jgi:hypothetical protein
MTPNSDELRANAEAHFKTGQTLQGKAPGMLEYSAAQQALQDKTARLREARLARKASG